MGEHHFGVTLLIVTVFCVLINGQNDENREKKEDNVDYNFSGHFIENVLKGAFDEQMPVIEESKMTDCYARLMCERICVRTMSGEIQTPRKSTTNYMINDASEAKSIEYLFGGGDVGYLLGQQRRCGQCAYRYSNCREEKYYTLKKQTEDYEKSVFV